ncbi:FecR domain-containing protein [Flammeovirga sp. EKP202]|uniref:FecR domain-containing protein n=1 Tax=Flammeovirga sp. EKP202 TaxID=2770592 RepID=UPI00165FE438|nr:FecR domain-containing protein [Flammeovirga sp. EKP202]MBD0401059.1 FecR domain-containing protein [Flammeovirga sp. EKP202]
MEKNNNIDEVLLTKYLLGETTEEEGRAVKLWIDYSAENKATFESFRKVWEATLTASIPEVNVDVDKAWNRMDEAIEAEVNTTKVVQFTPWKRIASSIAAIVLLAVGVNFYTSKEDVDAPTFVAVEVYQPEQPAMETLKDGSDITINGNSTLSVASFEGNSREVTLDGEAFFEIAHDESKPFIVHTSKGDITVLGTKFNVKATANDVIVTVTEGLVKLEAVSSSKKDRFVLLEKNSEGAIDANSAMPYKEENVSMNNLFWKTKALNFHNTSFAKVISTLESAYKVNISVNRESLNTKKLTVDFKENSIEEVFEILQATLNLQVQKTGDKAYYID